MADDRIGKKMATVRESLGLSREELAERAACDVSVIERLESGELAPSLAPLIKITRALGVRLGTLLDDDANVGPVVCRAADAERTARLKSLETVSDAGVLDFYSLAAGKSSRHMEPFVIDVNPAAVASHAPSQHEGEEFIYVLDGEIEVAYGKDVHRLGPGDSIYYDSIVPHEVRAAGDAPARILAVVYAPL
ncbi:cupin domain-containing protein [Coriobacteriia bacterium Es71-Z0120]|uniref:cupin domain-containing protein n=1 Tax=Parvivirga hydrogeniphila TaxID=2939460 RepID=UPI002260DBFA|nr:cupin domain-containing protein [Parvivirga hydrogeniphila]MCL4078002.1 cupin domain-containing protein [Parvivirga hydrogeniphila]